MWNDLKTLSLLYRNQKWIDRLRREPGLFGRVLRFVEIETHSYCNRICSFCPNSVLDRRSVTHYLPPEVYTKVLRQLETVGYDGSLSFIRYMEPLADAVIFDRVEEARGRLRRASLIMNSNGDYYDREVHEKLRRAGLTKLNIARYIDKPTRWSRDLARNVCEKFLSRHGLRGEKTIDETGHVLYRIRNAGFEMSVYSFDYVSTHYARGGTIDVEPYSRRSPCLFPFAGLYVDSNGECMPCCNMRSDNEEHKAFSYGNVAEQTLLDLFLSGIAKKLRTDLAGYGRPEAGPCQNCAYGVIGQNKLMRGLWQRIQKPKAPRKAAEGVRV